MFTINLQPKLKQSQHIIHETFTKENLVLILTRFYGERFELENLENFIKAF